jgi:hypothetical protein
MTPDQSLVDQLPHEKRLNRYFSEQMNNAEGRSRQVCVLIPVFVRQALYQCTRTMALLLLNLLGSLE